MKKTLLLSCLTVAAVALAHSADQEARPLQGIPKNLARQHLGANLFQYQPGTQAYTPTQASAAWLDDDITTGWPAMAGKQYYLLALPEAAEMTNFFISARAASGNVSLYVGDEPAPPTSKSWSQVAKDVPLESINEKKLDRPFSRVAKYLLIETNIADPGPIYSLYLYGQRPATGFAIHNRSEPIDTRAVFGAYVNDSTTFNVAGLYAQSVVKQADGSIDPAAQSVIDDNPETSTTLGGATGTSSVTVSLAQAQSISRIAVEVDPGAKGRLDFFVTDAAAPAADAAAAAPAPAASILLDGSNARASVDFAGVSGSALKAVWTPANGTDSLGLHELDAFSGLSLASSAVVPEVPDSGAAIAANDRTAARAARSDGKSDPKAIAEGKDDAPDAVAEGPTGPYLPGALGFPPNLTSAFFGPHHPVSQ